eukprot:TRINITY_DN64690_c0_g1_i1.p1 TRINITY_DN64690_c0_g1~~TRINITY_DN64690_c0_g1_i1.p1  ORF type:complete len:581 (-),score=137.45 TRINITY_DN64690_c0_g1_i1:72-1769(-)
MESDAAIALAVDILSDHFGPCAARVGRVLLERGSLTLQEILRFVNEGHKSSASLALAAVLDVNEVPFQAVRNTLLVLLRHGVVRAEARGDAKLGEARNVLMSYAVDVAEVIARLRFPHILEHVHLTHGELARELLFAVLQHGRVTRAHAIAEASGRCPDSMADEIWKAFQELVSEGYLNTVEAYSQVGSSSTAPPASVDDGKRGREDVPGAAPQASKRQRGEDGGALVAVAAEPSRSGPAKGTTPESVVYTFNAATFNLRLCKNLIGRFAEDKSNPYITRVLLALLTSVNPARSGGIASEYMRFSAVEQRLRDMGGVQVGRDPQREQLKLRKALDHLANEGFLVRCRNVNVTSAAPAGAALPGADGDPDDPVAPARGRGAGTGFEVVPEYCIAWDEARDLLVGLARSQLIREQFGMTGLRMFNFLAEREPPQKLEEERIFEVCMVPMVEGRQVLNAMVRAGFVRWQEIPKSANAPLMASYWLYYVDKKSVEHAIIQRTLWSILGLRVRFRAEGAQLAALESRASLGGQQLTPQDRTKLNAGRKREDALERSFLVLDGILQIFCCF